jgi:hypothetical protein
MYIITNMFTVIAKVSITVQNSQRLGIVVRWRKIQQNILAGILILVLIATVGWILIAKRSEDEDHGYEKHGCW